MTETRTYTGGCHCGEVRFEVTAAVDRLYSCNCSICGKMGWLLTFVPAAQFTLLSGAERLTDYQFGKKVIHHPFCSRCGVRSFCRGTSPNGEATCGVNVRCLDGVEFDGIPVTQFDGRSL